MKNMKYYLQFLVFTLCFSFIACSDDDENKTKPIFPDLQKIEGVVNETTQIEFEATSSWRLTSSALWCKFVIEGEEVNSCSGEAGKQTVTIKVLDEATELLKSYKSEISLWMNGYNEVICEVTRPATGYEIVLLDKDGNPYSDESPATVAYGISVTSFKVKSNFDWRLKSWPEWLSCSQVSDVAGISTTTISPKIEKGYTKDPLKGNLVFENEAGEEVAEIPVKYDGIPADMIEYSMGEYAKWNFSLDGRQYASSGGMETNWEDAPVVFTVIAKDDKYKIAFINKKDFIDTRVSSDESWFYIEDNMKGEIKLFSRENDAVDREGYLMIFPVGVYDAIGEENFDNIVLAGGELSDTYSKYAITLKQMGMPRGYIVKDTENQVESLKWLVDEGVSEETLKQEYETSNVYRLILKGACSQLALCPSGYGSGYIMTPVEFKSEDESSWEEAFASPDWSSPPYFNITDIPADAKGQMVVRVQNSNTGETFGVLIVEVKGNTSVE
ncbi:DUF5003 domain-containing protein [Bacteroides xylanisolvens]|uniref:DUF5003 domain-containing protein n=1 Tax=Bacteroides xylanisolvens TaxID=371601 RepID=UPI00374E403B